MKTPKMRDLTEKQWAKIKKFDPDEELKEWPAKMRRLKIKFSLTLKSDADRTYGYVHASSLGNPCDRNLYFQMKDQKGKYSDKISGDLQRRFDTGTIYHLQMEMYQKTRAKLYGYDYLSEVPAIGGFGIPIGGTMDGISIGWPIEEEVIWEYKSMSLNEFNRLTSPKEQHISQVHVYMRHRGAPISYITYICKDSAITKSFLIPFSWNVWYYGILERIESIEKMVSRKKMPNGLKNYYCNTCYYREYCDADDNNIKDLMNLRKTGYA